MDFVEATDKLMEQGVTLEDVAEALGVSYSTVRAVRLDPSSPSRRNPPRQWENALAHLARDRGASLTTLSEALRQQSDGANG